MLVRPKKNVAPQERVEKLLQQELFGKLHEQQPGFESKVHAVPGELTEPGMGISTEDAQRLYAQVTVVMHIAATIRFTEKLKVAVNLNVVATKRALEFSRSLAHLDAHVHVSTAFANTNRFECHERVYKPTLPPGKLMDIADLLTPAMADSMERTLVEGHPNTYTFTKNLAESFVNQEAKNRPVIIVRPSIVSASYSEPFPGWVDNLNGPTGMCLAVGTGFLRVLPIDRNINAEIVPVDFVANFIISSGHYVARKHADRSSLGGLEQPLVVNVTTSDHNPWQWGSWIDAVAASWEKYPLEKRVIRRPARVGDYQPKSYSLMLAHFVQQKAVSIAFDVMAMATGARPVLGRANNRLEGSIDDYAFFMTHKWSWTGNSKTDMIAAQTPEDRAAVNLDVGSIDWPRYIENSIIGIKKFMMREDMSRVAVARANQKRIGAVSTLIRAVVMYGFYRAIRAVGGHRRPLTRRIRWLLTMLAFYGVFKF